jgi:hypothetical protein
MLHQHLTLERYELAIEEDPRQAADLRSKAAGCDRCVAALAERPLHIVLSDWRLPPAAFKPVDWEGALRVAIRPDPAPALRPTARRPLRMISMLGILAALLVAAVLPAAAKAGPDSQLYPVRGAEENARVGVAGRGDRALLEAQFAGAYIKDAKSAADSHDSSGYRASMNRFGYWGQRLREDASYARPSARPAITGSIVAARTVIGQLKASGHDPAGTRQAEAVLNDAQSEVQAGDGQNQTPAPSGPASPNQGKPTASPSPDQQGSLPSGDGQSGDPPLQPPSGSAPTPGLEGDGSHGDG